MRTFIVLLILANLAYLGWNQTHSSQARQVLVRSPSEVADQTLQLLSEVPVPAEIPIETLGSCISLGVFNTTEESDFLVSALLERGMEARVELLPTEGNARYRVYMPPFNSDTAARQTLADLQSSGFDSFIITTGDLNGGISLGLFAEEDRALGLQEDLASRGFPTSIQEISTADNEIWVTIQGLSQELLEGSELLDLLSQGLDLEVIEKPCETFASRP